MNETKKISNGYLMKALTGTKKAPKGSGLSKNMVQRL